MPIAKKIKSRLATRKRISLCTKYFRDFLEAEFTEISAQYRILHAMGLLVEALRVTRPSTWQGENDFSEKVK